MGAHHTHVLAASMFPRAPPVSKLQAEITGDDIAFAVEAYPAPGAPAARGSISGTLTLTGGGAARGVMLTAVEPNRGITVGTLSDDDGTYELGPLPPGSYQVTAEPASGTVTPLDFQPADPAGFNTNVLSDFLGGALSPQSVQVLAGLDVPADFSIGEGDPGLPGPGLSIEFVGLATPGASLAGVSIGRAAFPLIAGEAADLVLAGAGIDATLSASHLRLLAPGLTIRPGSVGVEPGFTIGPFPIIRVTVDVAPRQGRDTGTLAIVKDGEVALFSGGLSIEGSGAPPPPPPTVPAVLSMGVVMGNLLPTINAISDESIISIFGRDFAPDGVDNRDTQLDPASGLVATNLSGVCVEIDGQRSPMFHVITEANPSDPTVDQVNVQAPTLMGAGPVSVVVISNCGTPDEQRSPAEPVQLSDRTPAFFLLEPILSLGPNPLVATHLDFSKIGDPNTHPGTTPAEPGEFIRMFGTGFGLTEPDVQAGEIPQNVPAVQDNNFLAPLVGDFRITIGGITLEGRPNVLAAGLSVCCAGLYEIVIKVPEGLADGNHEVIATIDGVSTPAGTFITVKAP